MEAEEEKESAEAEGMVESGAADCMIPSDIRQIEADEPSVNLVRFESNRNLPSTREDPLIQDLTSQQRVNEE